MSVTGIPSCDTSLSLALYTSSGIWQSTRVWIRQCSMSTVRSSCYLSLVTARRQIREYRPDIYRLEVLSCYFDCYSTVLNYGASLSKRARSRSSRLPMNELSITHIVRAPTHPQSNVRVRLSSPSNIYILQCCSTHPSLLVSSAASSLASLEEQSRYFINKMFNWLSRSASKQANEAIIHVSDSNPEITAEPIFDEEPALYIVFPHANNPGSQAPKVGFLFLEFHLQIAFSAPACRW